MEASKSILRGDKYIWGIYILLCIISIVEMFSASSTLTYKVQDYFSPAVRHATFLAFGTVLVVAIHNVPYKIFRAIPFVLLPLSLLLLIIALLRGADVNGAQRWVFGLQPSELAKLGVISGVAYLLSIKQTEKGTEPDTFWWIVAIVGPFCLLIFPENFSTAALLGLVCFLMMFIGRVDWKKLFLSIGILGALAFTLFAAAPIIAEKVPALDRIVTWRGRMERFSDKEGQPEYLVKTDDFNFQEHHARMAIANGGIFGQFIGNSRERDFLPQAYSDFIFAIIVEELGLIGGAFVLFLYLFLLFRAGKVAYQCEKKFPAFLMMGLALLIVIQALINMSVAVGFFPVTGQPLPLISRGGTSTLLTCTYFGIMLSISHTAIKKKKKKPKTGEDLSEDGSNVPAIEPENEIKDESETKALDENPLEVLEKVSENKVTINEKTETT